LTLVSVIDDDLSSAVLLAHYYKDETDRHIIVTKYDIAHHDLAKRFKNGIKRYAKKYDLEYIIDIVLLSDDTEIDFIDENSLVNLTNSPAKLTVLLTKTALENSTKIVTYDIKNSIFSYIDKECKIESVAKKIDISLEDLLLLQNYTIKSKKTEKQLAKNRDSIETIFQKQSLLKKVKDKLIYQKEFDKTPYIWILEILKEIGIVDENYDLINSKKSYLEGGILEEYIFWLVKEIEPDDIALGVIVDFDDSCQDMDKKIYNEFDILFIKDAKLYTIECKYKKYLEGLEVIYKYDAVMDYFGTNIKAMIVNISNTPKESFLNSKKSSNFSYSTIKRAKLANIHIYHESVINRKKFLKELKKIL